jgi:beta-phosphoglucomutase
VVLKAVIFDFDGVIADSEPCHFAAFNHILAEFGIEITEKQYYASYLGFTDYELLEDVARHYKTDYNGRSIKSLVEQKAEVFQKLIKQADHLIDGVKEFIGKLKKNGIRLAVNSGAIRADIEIMLQGTGLENSFEVIVSADDVAKGKPDPQGYLLALKLLNEKSAEPITAGRCIAIEDSRWGITSAKKAGMQVIAVTNSYTAGELTGADLVVDSLMQLDIGDLQKLCL